MRVTCPPEHEVSIWIRELSPDVLYLSLSYFNDPRYKYEINSFYRDGDKTVISIDNWNEDCRLFDTDFWKVEMEPETPEDVRHLDIIRSGLSYYSRSKETEQFIFISRNRMIESMGTGFFWDNWSNKETTA